MTDHDERIATFSPAKRELLSRWLSADGRDHPVPAADAPDHREDERVLVEIWQQVLEVDRIGVEDDYFELGGDSIHAIVIVARAQAAGLHITPQDLFAVRTIRAVARLATAGADGDRPPAAGPAHTDAAAEHELTPLQQGMLYHAVETGAPAAYLIQTQCRLVGELDHDAFATAWRAVFAANPTLRTVLRWADRERPRQMFVPALDLPIELVDHSGSDEPERDERIAELVEADRRCGFDLERGPLMRLTVVSLGRTLHHCVWTHHHLVLDGWSQQLVLRDVFDCYRQLVNGERPTPRRRPSYVDYLTWLGGRPDIDERSWRHRMDGAAPTRVAAGGCRRDLPAGPRRVAELPLPEPLAGGLREFTRRHGVTAGSLVHCGWALLLGIRTGRDDVLYGCTMSGRPPELPGATESVGLFVNTLPVRVRWRPDATALDWLRETQQELLALRDSQHVGLSRIERLIGLPTGAGLFDSIVVVENFPAWLGDGTEIAGLRVEDLTVAVEENFPLVVEFAPGSRAALRLRYDGDRVDQGTATGVLHALADYCAGVLADPWIRLDALRARVAATWRSQVERTGDANRDRARSTLLTARRRPVNGERS